MNISVDFNVGTSIQEACTEAKAFAIKMDLEWVQFKFNSISCSISQRCDVDKACEKFLEALKPDSKRKFVID